ESQLIHLIVLSPLLAPTLRLNRPSGRLTTVLPQDRLFPTRTLGLGASPKRRCECATSAPAPADGTTLFHYLRLTVIPARFRFVCRSAGSTRSWINVPCGFCSVPVGIAGVGPVEFPSNAYRGATGRRNMS